MALQQHYIMVQLLPGTHWLWCTGPYTATVKWGCQMTLLCNLTNSRVAWNFSVINVWNSFIRFRIWNESSFIFYDSHIYSCKTHLWFMWIEHIFWFPLTPWITIGVQICSFCSHHNTIAMGQTTHFDFIISPNHPGFWNQEITMKQQHSL